MINSPCVVVGRRSRVPESAIELHLPFIEAREQHRPVIDRPDAVVDLLAVYIGDSPEDITMARAAGVPSIAIPGPYPNHPSLLAAGPDAVAATLREAMRALG